MGHVIEGLKIGELAVRCGVSRDTVRFYEREGLFPKPRRTASQYRIYGEEDERRLRFIRQAQGIGLTLDDIGDLLRIQRIQTSETCRRVAARLRERIAAIDRKMSELQAFRRRLTDALARCEEGVSDSCPVVLDFAGGVFKKEKAG